MRTERTPIAQRFLSRRGGGGLAILGLLLAASPAPAADSPLRAPNVFNHPGLLNNLQELQFIKRKILGGEEPWTTAFETLRSSYLAKLTYTPHPTETPSGDIGGAHDKGCFNEINDAVAAYGHTLLWVLGDDERHAQKAVEILNAWSGTLKSQAGVNWYLQTAWVGSVFPLSAELLRATYPKWTREEITRFSAMLNRVFLPVLHRRLAYGNRELSVCNALAAIGVFNDDRAAFSEGCFHWVSYVPCYFYIAGDGAKPPKADYWLTEPGDEAYYRMHAGLFRNRRDSWIFADHNPLHLHDDKTMLTKTQEQDFDKLWYYPGRYVDGLCGETGRDLGHAEFAFAAAINVAEIAWHQGIDLYGIHEKRLTAFMEKHTSFRLGCPLPPTLYGGVLKPGDGISPTFEIAYNHYHNRKGLALPTTEKVIVKVIRQMQSVVTPAQPPLRATRLWPQAYYHIDWETLTHAGLGGAQPAPAPCGRRSAAGGE
jgi:hypothetical protein